MLLKCVVIVLCAGTVGVALWILADSVVIWFVRIMVLCRGCFLLNISVVVSLLSKVLLVLAALTVVISLGLT